MSFVECRVGCGRKLSQLTRTSFSRERSASLEFGSSLADLASQVLAECSKVVGFVGVQSEGFTRSPKGGSDGFLVFLALFAELRVSWPVLCECCQPPVPLLGVVVLFKGSFARTLLLLELCAAASELVSAAVPSPEKIRGDPFLNVCNCCMAFACFHCNAAPDAVVEVLSLAP